MAALLTIIGPWIYLPLRVFISLFNRTEGWMDSSSRTMRLRPVQSEQALCTQRSGESVYPIYFTKIEDATYTQVRLGLELDLPDFQNVNKVHLPFFTFERTYRC